MDFRSDTVTQPTFAMRQAMAEASVGDDVFREDPTVQRLEETAADLLGTEAALFACSGTMGNLLALLSHGEKGESVLLGAESHIYDFEVGGMAALGGLLPYPLEDRTGLPSPESLEPAMRRPDNIHLAPTTLLCLENTHNRAGGTAHSPREQAMVAQEGQRLGLKVHLDGARLFNACVAWNATPRDYMTHVDSVQICLSKGLGAPMGSLLCGPATLVERARRWRKALGGGMRQIGIVAAAGLLALTEMPGRLQEDHENAAFLVQKLESGGLFVEPCPRRTNMVYLRPFEDPRKIDVLQKRCEARSLRIGRMPQGRIRLVTHLGITRRDVEEAARILLEEVPPLI